MSQSCILFQLLRTKTLTSGSKCVKHFFVFLFLLLFASYFCQQHDHARVLSLLNHFYFESFSSHIIWIYIFVYIFIKLAIFILFLLTLTVMFFLHCMLNTLRHEKIFCEIDESIAYYDYLLLLTII